MSLENESGPEREKVGRMSQENRYIPTDPADAFQYAAARRFQEKQVREEAAATIEPGAEYQKSV